MPTPQTTTPPAELALASLALSMAYVTAPVEPWVESLVAEFGAMPIYDVLDHLVDDPSDDELASVDYLDPEAVARTLSAINAEVSR